MTSASSIICPFVAQWKACSRSETVPGAESRTSRDQPVSVEPFEAERKESDSEWIQVEAPAPTEAQATAKVLFWHARPRFCNPERVSIFVVDFVVMKSLPPAAPPRAICIRGLCSLEFRLLL